MAVRVDETAEAARRALCANVSAAGAEPLAANASRVDHWILVEYRGLWEREILGGSRLSQELKDHLRGQLRQLGNARLLFVKQPERRSHRRRQLFFGSSRPGEERLYGLEFTHHDEVLGLDLAGALTGAEACGSPVEHPLLVVCAHGKRDRCCAKYGCPLYDDLRRKVDPGWVWQSTHVGGDRFAGNVVVLPAGLYYGRVGAGDVGPLLAEQAAGRIHLDLYRGRSAYSFPVQAAEQAVRVEEGLTGIGDVAFVGAERDGDGWRVRLRDPTGAVHEVDVVEERGEEAVYLTCTSAAPQRARRYVAVARRVRRP
jgi:hypothetical protein